MIKTNLPVIVLRGLVLLPNNEIRIEFDDDVSRNIIDVAELFHDNNILVVSQIDPLEEDPDIKDLPKIGVISKINHKLELPNGRLRVVIKGIERAIIHEYMDLNRTSEVLESIVSENNERNINSKDENLIINKLKRELEDLVKRFNKSRKSYAHFTAGVAVAHCTEEWYNSCDMLNASAGAIGEFMELVGVYDSDDVDFEED